MSEPLFGVAIELFWRVAVFEEADVDIDVVDYVFAGHVRTGSLLVPAPPGREGSEMRLTANSPRQRCLGLKCYQNR